MIVKHFMKNSVIDDELLSHASNQVMLVAEILMQVLVI